MPTYALSLSANKKTVSVRLGADTAPVGDTSLGTFDHDESDDPIHAFSLNHALFHHVREILYKRKASDGSAGATYPNGIYNMQDISIVRYGPVINHEYMTAAALSVVAAATVTAVIKYQPQDVNASNADFTFESSDETKATVASTGVVTGVAAGSAVITATSKIDGKSIDIAVTVTAV